MTRILVAALAAAALVPAAASAQVYYHGPAVTYAPAGCVERDARLHERGLWLDSRKREIDREGAALANELRNLDNRDLGAVVSYNARSAEHNRRVAELNAGVADYNAGMQSMVSECSYAYVAPPRRDVIIWERSTIR